MCFYCQKNKTFLIILSDILSNNRNDSLSVLFVIRKRYSDLMIGFTEKNVTKNRTSDDTITPNDSLMAFLKPLLLQK